MSGLIAVWNFFEGMRANPHDDDVLKEYRARQRQLFGAIFLLLLMGFAIIGATSFFNAAEANPNAPLAMFAPYRNTVGVAFLVVYGVLGTFSMFCAYRIMKLRSEHGVQP